MSKSAENKYILTKYKKLLIREISDDKCFMIEKL